MRVAFLHPDLGVGGAERLVVDAAKGLQARGHTVHVFTAYHSPAHCFPETTDGALGVTVWSFYLPHHLLRKGHALFATLKMGLLTLRLILSGQAQGFDVVVVDQVAVPLPVLRAFCAPCLFYCHFPDKLCDATLACPHRSFLRQAYRCVFDAAEEWCITFASTVAFNSRFTKETTLATFPSLADPALGGDTGDDILYPPVPMGLARPTTETPKVQLQGAEHALEEVDLVEFLASHRALVSLNRFERKKNVELAIRTMAILRGKGLKDIALIIAGGYDSKVAENVEYLEELKGLVLAGGLKGCVYFMPSVNDQVKKVLLQRASVLVYTPPSEHFGIVPVEAMACGTPVVAVDHGGPRESILHQRTGYLAPASPLEFAAGVLYCLEHRAELAAEGRQWAADMFSQASFAEALEAKLIDVIAQPPLPHVPLFAALYAVVVTALCATLCGLCLVAVPFAGRAAMVVGAALIPILAGGTAVLFTRRLHLPTPHC